MFLFFVVGIVDKELSWVFYCPSGLKVCFVQVFDCNTREDCLLLVVYADDNEFSYSSLYSMVFFQCIFHNSNKVTNVTFQMSTEHEYGSIGSLFQPQPAAKSGRDNKTTRSSGKHTLRYCN